MPRVRSSSEPRLVRRADQLRHQLGLLPGESALLVVRGPGAGSVFRLGLVVVTVGRSAGATVILDDISVSRRHAEIRPVPQGYRIADVGSLNGTYLNDTRVEEAPLAHGDEIQIGLFKLCFLHKAPASNGPAADSSGRP
jgi:pSer/pThr/pTyr-binding forkhead associated (FHA) protein